MRQSMTLRRILARLAHLAAWGYAIVGIVLLAIVFLWVIAWGSFARAI
jgi:hypothetical protein